MKHIICVQELMFQCKRLCRLTLMGRFLITCLLTIFISCAIHAQEKQVVQNESFLHIDTSNYSQAQLFEFLKSPKEHVRQFAVLRLAEQENITEPALKSVINALGDKSEKVRLQAVAGLMRMGSVATKMLAKELTNSAEVGEYIYNSEALNGTIELNVKRSDLAFMAIRYSNSADGDVLLDLYRSSSEKIKKHIRELLKTVPVQITPELYEALSGKDMELAVAAAMAFQKMGPGAIEAVPKLVSLIKDGRDEIANAAAKALANIPHAGDSALRDLFRSAKIKTKCAAINVYPYEADSAAFFLFRSIKDSNVNVQFAALRQLRSNYFYDYNEYPFQPKAKGYSAFIAAIPDSVIQDIKVLLNSKTSRLRLDAVSALASIALIRKDYARDISNALVQQLSDPDKGVHEQVIRAIANLVEIGITPDSKNAERLIIGQLKNSESNQVNKLLYILEKLEITGAPDKNLVSLLLDACTNRVYSCEKIASVLRSKPGWAEEAIHILVTRYPDVNQITEEKFSMLAALGPGGEIYSGFFQKFLTHQTVWMREKAAIILANENIVSEKILEVLEEGAKKFEGYGGTTREAAHALAAINPKGLDRIIALINDKKTSNRTRDALVYYTLRGLVNKNDRVAEIILSFAKNSSEPGMQKAAVSVLGSFTKSPGKLKDAFEQAFLSKDKNVRYDVVYAWTRSGLEPGDFLNKVIADTSPEVRKTVFILLDSLPPTDRRRVDITKRAVEDKNEAVVNAALEFSKDLGAEGAAIYENYLRSGRPLNYQFFSGISAFAPLSGSMVDALQSRKRGASSEIRRFIDEALIFAIKVSSLNLADLYKQLKDTSETESYSAAKTLFILHEDIWANEGLIAAVLMRAEVKKMVKGYLGEALDYLYPPGMTFTGATMSFLPPFPWPPPAGFRRVVIPYHLFKSGSASTMGGIYNSLTRALNVCDRDFEHGLFGGIPNGYALIARMEHIKEDGTPLSGKARWTKDGNSTTGLMSLFSDLFFEKPGYFRIIVFVLTDDINPTPNPKAILLTVERGSPAMDGKFATKPITNQSLLALVYTFERKGKGKITPWTEGIPSAQSHLEKSGIWTQLNK